MTIQEKDVVIFQGNVNPKLLKIQAKEYQYNMKVQKVTHNFLKIGENIGNKLSKPKQHYFNSVIASSYSTKAEMFQMYKKFLKSLLYCIIIFKSNLHQFAD